MKSKFLFVLTLVIASSFIFVSCSDDDDPAGPLLSKVGIIVKSSADSAVIPVANVILYNASNGSSVSRAYTGADGIVFFENLNPGTFFVKITAQNFNALPPEGVSSVPFSAEGGHAVNMTYFMSPLQSSTPLGKISGYVNPRIDGVLIKAYDGVNSYSTYTGPDGFFVIFNLPYASYTLSAFKSNYRTATEPQVTVSGSNTSPAQDLAINLVTGGRLSGSVTFLAVENGIVDVSLLDRQTWSAINGLSTKIDSNKVYNIQSIPKGEYLAWASYKNDGYVMDPDWIFKNPGGLDISFSDDTSSKSLNFSVTGAIKVVSPTNTALEIIPVEADSSVPLFQWNAYSSAKEYIIEVRDVNGNLIWGGFEPNGTIRHSQITKDKNSIRFNFDGSASTQLVKGQIYQWKIYADDDTAPGVQTLISSSEDLMGLFVLK